MYVIRKAQEHHRNIELHLYKKVGLFVRPSIHELSWKKKVERTHLLVDQTCFFYIGYIREFQSMRKIRPFPSSSCAIMIDEWGPPPVQNCLLKILAARWYWPFYCIGNITSLERTSRRYFWAQLQLSNFIRLGDIQGQSQKPQNLVFAVTCVFI